MGSFRECRPYSRRALGSPESGSEPGEAFALACDVTVGATVEQEEEEEEEAVACETWMFSRLLCTIREPKERFVEPPSPVERRREDERKSPSGSKSSGFFWKQKLVIDSGDRKGKTSKLPLIKRRSAKLRSMEDEERET